MIPFPFQAGGLGRARASASSGSGYLYWCVQVVAVQGGTSTSCSIGEIEMRATPGGADQCTGGTASASSTFAPYVPANAFDNLGTTRWASQPSQPSRIIYLFPAPVNVGEVMIQAPDAGNYASTQMVKDFNIQRSNDGTNWTTERVVTGETTMTASQQRTYSVP